VGNGVQSEPPPDLQIELVLEFFDKAVIDGNLVGSGKGNSSQGRLGALRNMIEAAGDLIGNGQFEEACDQLYAAFRHTDGSPKPPDFVTGTSATDLADQLQAIRLSLGCQ